MRGPPKKVSWMPFRPSLSHTQISGLYGHESVEMRIPALVDHTHAATPKGFDDFVMLESASDHGATRFGTRAGQIVSRTEFRGPNPVVVVMEYSGRNRSIASEANRYRKGVGLKGARFGIPAASVSGDTGVMRETDLRDTEALLIQLSHRAMPDREASLILERVKLYLADQFNRGDHPYVLPAEFAAAGKTTRRFYPREGDARPKPR